ncbi:MAG: HK97 family phage prohead protease [Candidatus Thermoplasmatota archaeon]|nr:HK97 family phage prohead protease [Candidatus Thermoplasmatota archaeon]
MDKMVRVELPLELKQDEGLVVGYANRAIPDDVNHLIPADVWLSGLQRYFREGMPVKLLHRPKLTVGETVWLKVVDDGLVLASRPTVPEVRGMIERGLLTSYSVGFFPKAWRDREDGIREFTDLELVEVSYVDEPMNPGSYFEVVPKMLEGHEIHFDATTGTVTVHGLVPEEMAQLSSLLKGALTKAGIGSVENIQAIEFKAAAPSAANASQAEEKNREEDTMSLLKRIWDAVRGKSKMEATDDGSDKMSTAVEKQETQPTANNSTTVLTIPDPNAEVEQKFSKLSEQLKAQEAAVTELKGMVEKLAKIIDSFVPPPNSTPVLDTSQGKEKETKFKWGLLGPTD